MNSERVSVAGDQILSALTGMRLSPNFECNHTISYLQYGEMLHSAEIKYY